MPRTQAGSPRGRLKDTEVSTYPWHSYIYADMHHYELIGITMANRKLGRRREDVFLQTRRALIAITTIFVQDVAV